MSNLLCVSPSYFIFHSSIISSSIICSPDVYSPSYFNTGDSLFFQFPDLILYLLPSQEEIKIISADVFVNPYAESDDEEEGKTNEEDKNVKDEDSVSFRLLICLFLFCLPSAPLPVLNL